MATIKASTTIWDAQTLTAGAGDTTSSAIDFTDGYGGDVFISITNGATGPTVPAQVQIQVSPDSTDWFDYGGPLVAGDGNDEITTWTVEIDPGVLYVRLVAGSNTAQDVVIDAQISEITSI